MAGKEKRGHLVGMQENGPRISKLCKALEKAVELTSKPLPKEEFLRLFGWSLSQQERELLGGAYDEMHQQLLTRVEVCCVV